MQSVASNISIAEYCEDMQDGKVIANPEYQRSDKVWPSQAQSFLIETILLGFPIPKIALNQILDLKSRQVIREIVDGQQRSRAIFNFFQGRLKLSRAIELEEAKGCAFDDLSDDLKSAFLTYPLTYDLFTNTTPADVREVFRRINLYTVPLNPEEQRHAVFQGSFKIFIYHLSRVFSQPLSLMGVLSDKQIVRMQDAKLFTEISHACLNGITTTSKASLNALYAQKDKSFPEGPSLEMAFTYAIDRLLTMNDLHGTPLMKPYQFYALTLALMHLQFPQEKLQALYPVESPVNFDPITAIRNLSILADALETDDAEDAAEDDEEDDFENFNEFVLASTSRTNVASQRATRFMWMCKALAQSDI